MPADLEVRRPWIALPLQAVTANRDLRFQRTGTAVALFLAKLLPCCGTIFVVMKVHERKGEVSVWRPLVLHVFWYIDIRSNRIESVLRPKNLREIDTKPRRGQRTIIEIPRNRVTDSAMLRNT